MNKLKIKWLGVFLLLATVGCQKEQVGLQVQAHDQNQMMQIMHQMMDKMMAMQKTGDPDIDFAMMMRMHHQGAIDMANNELQRGDDTQIKDLANRIIAEQQKEITQLSAFLNTHQPTQQQPAFGQETMMAMEKMGRNSDLQVITGDADNDMVALMIPHHQSAVENAQSVLKYGKDESIRILAQQIIDSQKKEIVEMQTWWLAHKPF